MIPFVRSIKTLARRFLMAAIPDDLTQKLSAAEDAMADAREKDAALADAGTALSAAQAKSDGAKADSLASHQSANALAQTAIDALKAHFGLG